MDVKAMMMTEDDADKITIRDDGHVVEEEVDDKSRENSASSKRKWKTCFLFLLVVLAYLFVGALVFRVLERPVAVQASKNFEAALQRLASENDCMNEADVAKLMDIVTRAIGEGGYATGHPYASHLGSGTIDESFYSDMWSVKQSFILTSTVVTTTGFGYHAPRTVYGQLVCVPYAIIGIFVTGGILVSASQILQQLCLRRITTCLIRNARRMHCFKAGEVLVNIIFVYLVMIIPVSIMYYLILSDWSYIDSHYFSVVMMTTIGFGDLEPVFEGLPIIELYLVRIVLFTYLFVCLGAVSSMLDTLTEAQRGGSVAIVQLLSRLKEILSLRHQLPEENANDIELETQEVTCFSHCDDQEEREADDDFTARQSCVTTPDLCVTTPESLGATPESSVTTPESCVTDHVSCHNTPGSFVTTPESSVIAPDSCVTTHESSVTTQESRAAASPESSITTPEPCICTAPGSCVTTPEFSAIVPETCATAPGSCVNTARSFVIIPDSSITTPEASIATPEASVTAPESCVTAPEPRCVTTPEQSTTESTATGMCTLI